MSVFSGILMHLWQGILPFSLASLLHKDVPTMTLHCFPTYILPAPNVNTLPMKTPERSRTSPNCTVLLPQSAFLLWIERRTQIHYVTSPDVMMSYCDVTWSHTIGHDFTWEFPSGKSLSCDLDLWPTTLTYNTSLAKVKVNPHTKNQGHRSNGSGVRVLTHTHTHRRKDGSESITSTADAGGKEIIVAW